MRDLVVLAADNMIRSVVTQILERQREFGFGRCTYQIQVGTNRDPYVVRKAHDFLRPSLGAFRRAIAICDHDGCGRERTPASALEQVIETNLVANGWADDRCCAVIIEPELEAWMFGDWQALTKCVRWESSSNELRTWLEGRRLIGAAPKPTKPKEAFDELLRAKGRKPSTAFREEYARAASARGCTDRAFLKLLETLKRWFPA